MNVLILNVGLFFQFEQEEVSIPYKGQDCKFDVHFKPLWEWTMDLLEDPLLAPHWVWDAEKISKFNGTEFVQLFHEPWTANGFWKAQVRCLLPMFKI